MMNTPIPDDITIWPVEEMVHEDEFTDRVKILRELDQWVAAIQRMAAPSTALIAPRRTGKTVLLDRLALIARPRAVAPMLASGSAVTMVFRTVMGGPLGGRFGFRDYPKNNIPPHFIILSLKIHE
jgi:hypothetical protein